MVGERGPDLPTLRRAERPPLAEDGRWTRCASHGDDAGEAALRGRRTRRPFFLRADPVPPGVAGGLGVICGVAASPLADGLTHRGESLSAAEAGVCQTRSLKGETSGPGDGTRTVSAAMAGAQRGVQWCCAANRLPHVTKTARL